MLTFDELNSYRQIFLNPSSHDSYDVPKFEREVSLCISTLKQLKEIKNQSFLRKKQQIEFELREETSMSVFKFELVLEDDFRLLKVGDGESVISKGVINYYVTKDGVRGKRQHCTDSIKHFYEINYQKSDKTKSSDFWNVILLSDTNELLISKRIY